MHLKSAVVKLETNESDGYTQSPLYADECIQRASAALLNAAVCTHLCLQKHLTDACSVLCLQVRSVPGEVWAVLRSGTAICKLLSLCGAASQVSGDEGFWSFCVPEKGALR